METLKKYISCSICLQLFKSPRTLQCCHTFCEQCLQGHINKTASTFSDSEKGFECPLCRTKISSETKTKDRSEWAKSFPLNNFIVTLLDDFLKLDKNVSNNDSVSKICFPCHIDGKKSDAFGFCTICVEFLCKECLNEHRKFKTTRSHCVLKGSDLPKDITPFQKLAESSICKTHSDKEIEFKCISHDEFICSLCAVTMHKQCEQLVPLQKLDKSFKRPDVILEKIIKTEELADQKISDSFAHAQRLNVEVSKVENMKQNFITKLINVIKNIRKEFGATYTGQVKLHQSKLALTITECAVIVDSLNSLKAYASVVMKYGNPAQIELLTHEIMSQEKKICNSLQLLSDTEYEEVPDVLTDSINALRKSLEDIIARPDSSTSHVSEPADDVKPMSIVEPEIICDTQHKVNETQTKTESESNRGVHLRYKDIETQTQTKLVSGSVGNPGYKDNETQTRPESRSEGTGTLGDKETQTKTGPTSETTEILRYKENETQTNALEYEQQVHDTLVGSEDDSSASSKNFRNFRYSERLYRAESETNLNSDRVFSLPHRRAPVTLLDNELYKVGHHDLCIAVKTMEECSHKASVIRSDGWMVFMDAENKVIKLVNPDFKVKSYKIMEVQPLDMCLTSNEHIAVATSKGICIFPTEKEKLGNPTYFPMKYDPVSVCSVGENLAILCSYKRENKNVSCIQIRKLTNEIVKQIDTFTNNKGKSIDLYDPRMVRTWGPGEFIVCEPRYVKRFDDEGNLKWYFTESDLQNLTYIASDSEKNIYMCELNKGYVYQISSSWYNVSRIIAYGIGKPSSVVFNPKNKTLIVGCWLDNKVYVYEFRHKSGT